MTLSGTQRSTQMPLSLASSQILSPNGHSPAAAVGSRDEAVGPGGVTFMIVFAGAADDAGPFPTEPLLAVGPPANASSEVVPSGDPAEPHPASTIAAIEIAVHPIQMNFMIVRPFKFSSKPSSSPTGPTSATRMPHENSEISAQKQVRLWIESITSRRARSIRSRQGEPTSPVTSSVTSSCRASVAATFVVHESNVTPFTCRK
jgi:hypothetical protein